MTQSESPRPVLPVGDLLTETIPGVSLRLLAGEKGLQRPILSDIVQKPGLALAAEQVETLSEGSVQVLGRSEVAYLTGLPPAQRQRVLTRIGKSRVACLILARGAEPPADLVSAAEAHAIPVLSSHWTSSQLIDNVGRHLEKRLAPSITIHGTFIDIYGVGVLILGESGVGKSESALELILRGHRLISDDTVSFRRIGSILNGTGAEVSRYHMELRGIGIINIKDLFGVAAVRERKDVDLVVHLDRWQENKDYDRLGLDTRSYTLLSVNLPFIELPVGPGRNLSILLEVAARHYLLRTRGYHPARELATRIQRTLGEKE